MRVRRPDGPAVQAEPNGDEKPLLCEQYRLFVSFFWRNGMDVLIPRGPQRKRPGALMDMEGGLQPIPDSYEGVEWDTARKKGLLLDPNGNVVNPRTGEPLVWNGEEWMKS